MISSDLSLALAESVRARVRDVPDFPKPGVMFKDLTPVLAHGPSFQAITQAFVDHLRPLAIDQIVAIEARGFAVGAPIAVGLGVGLTLLRKPGKLPWEKKKRTYDLEYGADALEIHADALSPGHRVVIIDDVLATGGTMRAAVALVRDTGATVVETSYLVELAFLGGRAKLDVPSVSLLKYG